jgi:hypothetical protein
VEFELHVKQFAFQIREQDEISGFADLSHTDRRAQVIALQRAKVAREPNARKRRERHLKYRDQAPFIHLTRAERSQLLEDAVSLIADHQGIVLFAEAISKQHPSIVAGTVNPIAQAFEQVVSRFDSMLKKRDLRRYEASPRARINHGLLIIDHDTYEGSLQAQFASIRKDGHSFGHLTHVIDVPFFASSERVSALQLVDVCAYVIRRYLDTGARPGSHEERQFKSIFPKFDRDTHGKLHGVRHYIPSGICDCMICRERGHARLAATSSPAGP